jgi:hypothetical protein
MDTCPQCGYTTCPICGYGYVGGVVVKHNCLLEQRKLFHDIWVGDGFKPDFTAKYLKNKYIRSIVSKSASIIIWPVFALGYAATYIQQKK